MLLACLLLALIGWGSTPAAHAEAVRIGYAVTIDLPWISVAESEVKGGPGVRGAQTYFASFWSTQEHRALGVVAFIPKRLTYFGGDDESLDEQITIFFKGKKITDRHGIGCVYGSCLAFKADDLACAVFRRQIGTSGKARGESAAEVTAGPRLYGYYCSAASPTIDSREMDTVLHGIKAGTPSRGGSSQPFVPPV
jgi:hypothetical protein